MLSQSLVLASRNYLSASAQHTYLPGPGQALPDAAGSNGTYVIEQTGGQMALTPLTTPKEIPDVPTSTDGTFALQATVSSGNVTYAWVSVT